MNTSLALTACAVAGMLIGNLAVTADNAKVFQPVANEVADTVANETVVNNVANNVTTIETEVYRVVCVEEKSGYCAEFSVRRIVKE